MLSRSATSRTVNSRSWFTSILAGVIVGKDKRPPPTYRRVACRLFERSLVSPRTALDLVTGARRPRATYSVFLIRAESYHKVLCRHKYYPLGPVAGQLGTKRQASLVWSLADTRPCYAWSCIVVRSLARCCGRSSPSEMSQRPACEASRRSYAASWIWTSENTPSTHFGE